MLGFEILAEKRIKEAIRNGELDNLPNKGKPLIFEDLSHVPAELRMGFKVMKNSGVLPEEMLLKKEIYNLEQLLENSDIKNEEKESVKQKLYNKITHYRSMIERKNR